MARRFSIITTCKGRLEHLERSLPSMLAQKDTEVIVVDYSCPDGTADHVERHFTDARVVRVDGEDGFSNWKARNRGAAVADSDLLVFCDADTILAPKAVQVISDSVPEDAFGFFPRHSTAHFNRTGLRLGMNQLRGFQAIPAAAFRLLEGYDEVLEGYAAGGDTDVEDRLTMLGFKAQNLGDGIVEDVIEHDNRARFTYHSQPIKLSYAAGMLYRRAKLALLKMRRTAELGLDERQRLYTVAMRAARSLQRGETISTFQVNFEQTTIGMPRQLGFERGQCTVSINVKIAMQNKIGVPPQ